MGIKTQITRCSPMHCFGITDMKVPRSRFWNRLKGQNLLHKRAAVSAFLNQVKPKEVLDVGCGDCEVLSDVELAASYLGVDISSSIIARNKRRFSDKAFACLDFAALVDIQKYRADVVLCFEVLIHQHRRGEYVRLVANLVAATRKRG